MAIRGKSSAGIYRRLPSRPAYRPPSRAVMVAQLPQVKPRPASPKPKSAVASTDVFSLAISDSVAAARSVLVTPLVMIVAAISAVFITSYIWSVTGDSLFDQFMMPYNTTMPALYSYYDSNPIKIYGLLAFLPVYLALKPDLPDRALIAVAGVAWVMLVPEAGVVEYAIQALALHVFFNTNRPSTKTIVVSIVAALYFFGYAVKPGSAASLCDCSQFPDTCFDSALNFSTTSDQFCCSATDLPHIGAGYPAEYLCNLVVSGDLFARNTVCTTGLINPWNTARVASSLRSICAGVSFSGADLCRYVLDAF
jgi:hypothetical protein